MAFVDLAQSQLELAESLGFTPPPSGSAALVQWQHSADLVVEATGVPAVAANITHDTANGGSGLYFGVCPSDAQIEVVPFDMFHRQLTLAESHSLNHNIPRALKVLSSIGRSIDRLVSHRMSLEEASSILATKPPSASLKVQFLAD